MAILGELDAIGCPDSLAADPLTGAAHACGHNQTAAMLGAAYGLVKSGVMSELAGDVVFFGVPKRRICRIGLPQNLSKKESFISFTVREN